MRETAHMFENVHESTKMVEGGASRWKPTICYRIKMNKNKEEYEGHMVDALAPEGDEGRGDLR